MHMLWITTICGLSYMSLVMDTKSDILFSIASYFTIYESISLQKHVARETIVI